MEMYCVPKCEVLETIQAAAGELLEAQPDSSAGPEWTSFRCSVTKQPLMRARVAKGRIVVCGSIAQKPWHGGHTWVFLQYLLGFRKLGWDVLFLDRLEPEMCVSEDGTPCDLEHSVNLGYFLRVMQEFGFQGAYTLLSGSGTFMGLSRQKVLENTGESAILLNVMGFLRDPEILERARNRVFLDIDPGFSQMWQELKLQNVCSGHHRYVTIGENVGQPECGLPTCGLNWVATRQPIVLDYWPVQRLVPLGPLTTVASWRGACGPIPFRGRTYGLRVHEFRKFICLPALTERQFELALDIHPGDAADKASLEERGWRLVSPRTVACDPWRYRKYVQQSAGEFMVAKNMYVETHSGWFSDRSICYLASGRPVLAQDTGLKQLYPGGRGLLTFGSLEGAVAGVEELSRDYPAHSRAARELAAEYFDSDKVLGRLLDRLGIN